MKMMFIRQSNQDINMTTIIKEKDKDHSRKMELPNPTFIPTFFGRGNYNMISQVFLTKKCLHCG